MKNNQDKNTNPDVRQEVMQTIRNKKIKMTKPFVFLAQKLGLQGVLALSILGGAFVLNASFYLLKKTGDLNFLSFGWKGLGVFLLALPYDFIALLLIAVILANYIIHKLDFSVGAKFSANLVILVLFLLTISLGIIFAVMGTGEIFKSWAKSRIPKDIAIHGKILESSDEKAIIEEEDGKQIEVIFKSGVIFPFKPEYAKGKQLRAIGERKTVKKDDDDEQKNVFYVDDVRCCESGDGDEDRDD